MDEAGNEQSQERQGGGWGIFRLIWVFGVVVLLYAGSIGPVYKLCERGVLPSGVSVIYWPLIGVSHWFPPVYRALAWYIFDVWKCDDAV